MIKRAGLIQLTAFADAAGPFSDPNPFADPRTLDIDEIVIKFAYEGKPKRTEPLDLHLSLAFIGSAEAQRGWSVAGFSLPRHFR